MAKAEVIAEPGKQEIIITRVFNAPRDLVFKTFTDAKHLAKWWGQDTTTTTIDQLEASDGGKWRFVQTAPDGSEYAFRGVFHAIKAPEQIVQTFEFEGMPGHVLLETMTFESTPDGKTKIIDSSVFQSVADRDGMLQSGMEDGANQSWNRLDTLLETLK